VGVSGPLSEGRPSPFFGKKRATETAKPPKPGRRQQNIDFNPVIVKRWLEKPMTMWYEYMFDNRGAKDEIKAHIRVPPDSPWFDGHFPEAPLLPGVAQLGMVHDLLIRILDAQRPVTQVSRVRFKQMIRPDQPLVLTVKTGAEGASHSFRITGGEGLICSGQIQLGALKSEPRPPGNGE
jgi:3-hydroxyacyl-[acyl-carrier-protein] dehydratase